MQVQLFITEASEVLVQIQFYGKMMVMQLSTLTLEETVLLVIVILIRMHIHQEQGVFIPIR